MLAEATGRLRPMLLNDLQAVGRAIDHLAPGDVLPLIVGKPVPGPSLVIGVGTGFNAALVLREAGRVLVPVSEAGDASLLLASPDDLLFVPHLSGGAQPCQRGGRTAARSRKSAVRLQPVRAVLPAGARRRGAAAERWHRAAPRRNEPPAYQPAVVVRSDALSLVAICADQRIRLSDGPAQAQTRASSSTMARKSAMNSLAAGFRSTRASRVAPI